mmetsp:Transcript_5360/g.24140  ORF Transcript_5360/g.24140 Transcript_5360/m.24140 type:complete len:288 (-) Transcript_5360:1413-2276(-)
MASSGSSWTPPSSPSLSSLAASMAAISRRMDASSERAGALTSVSNPAGQSNPCVRMPSTSTSAHPGFGECVMYPYVCEFLSRSTGPNVAMPMASNFCSAAHASSHARTAPSVTAGSSTVGNSARSTTFSGMPSEIAHTHVVPPPSTPANRLPLTLGTMPRSFFMLLVGWSVGIATPLDAAPLDASSCAVKISSSLSFGPPPRKGMKRSLNAALPQPVFSRVKLSRLGFALGTISGAISGGNKCQAPRRLNAPKKMCLAIHGGKMNGTELKGGPKRTSRGRQERSRRR